MSLTTEIVRGMVILWSGEPYLVLDREFYKPGKGSAYNRLKLKNLKNGRVLAETLKTSEKVEQINVDTRSMDYMYAAGNEAYFMDPVSFDQVTISLDMIPGGTDYLHTDGKYIATSYEGKVLTVQLPIKLTLIVTETGEGSKGNTATNAYKDAILETGMKVQVPLFIQNGEKIIVNTETGTYISKA